MNKLKHTLILFSIVSISNAQITCDTIAITEIVNLQMKMADKNFGCPFVLSKSSVPFDTTKEYYEPDSNYSVYACGKHLLWNVFSVQSRYGKVESDTTTNKEYSLFISSPLFNKELNKCRVVVSNHFGEWGGSGRYYFYEKKGKKWKFARQTLIWVS